MKAAVLLYNMYFSGYRFFSSEQTFKKNFSNFAQVLLMFSTTNNERWKYMSNWIKDYLNLQMIGTAYSFKSVTKHIYNVSWYDRNIISTNVL